MYTILNGLLTLKTQFYETEKINFSLNIIINPLKYLKEFTYIELSLTDNFNKTKK